MRSRFESLSRERLTKGRRVCSPCIRCPRRREIKYAVFFPSCDVYLAPLPHKSIPLLCFLFWSAFFLLPGFHLLSLFLSSFLVHLVSPSHRPFFSFLLQQRILSLPYSLPRFSFSPLPGRLLLSLAHILSQILPPPFAEAQGDATYEGLAPAVVFVSVQKRKRPLRDMRQCRPTTLRCKHQLLSNPSYNK